MSAIRSPAAPERSRIYEKIISSALQERRWETIADLVAEVKDRAARLRLPYGHHELDQAFTAMRERLQREVGARPVAAPVSEPQPVAPLTTTPEVKARLAAIAAKVGRAAVIKRMPDAPVLSSRQVDRARAFALVVQGIRGQAAVCEALERQGPSGEDSAAVGRDGAAGAQSPDGPPSPEPAA